MKSFVFEQKPRVRKESIIGEHKSESESEDDDSDDSSSDTW